MTLFNDIDAVYEIFIFFNEFLPDDVMIYSLQTSDVKYNRFEENDNLLSSFSNEAICIDLSFLRA